MPRRQFSPDEHGNKLTTINSIPNRETCHASSSSCRPPKFSEEFVSPLLARNINLEEDLCDQLFNHSERRLACALLKLTRVGEHDTLQDTKLPKFTQKMLAEIVGATPSKVGLFMNKFRRLGLIDYRGTGDITVKAERLTEAVLHD
jgi:hypothetical protein